MKIARLNFSVYHDEDDGRQNVDAEAEADVDRAEREAPVPVLLLRKVSLVGDFFGDVDDGHVVSVDAGASNGAVFVQLEVLHVEVVGRVEVLQKLQDVVATEL